MALALLAFVIALDQVTKWWACRDVPNVSINFGGSPSVGNAVGGWYANPVTGALLDLRTPDCRTRPC
jgi:lipoprotein signal peptidase